MVQASTYFNPAEVEKIQTALTTLGFDPGTIDGAMGRRTRTAIKGFQFEIDMKETGRLTKAQKIILFDRAAAANANDTESETEAGLDVFRQCVDRQRDPEQHVQGRSGQHGPERDHSQVQPTTSSVSSAQGRIKVQKALTALGYPTGNEDRQDDRADQGSDQGLPARHLA